MPAYASDGPSCPARIRTLTKWFRAIRATVTPPGKTDPAHQRGAGLSPRPVALLSLEMPHRRVKGDMAGRRLCKVKRRHG